MSDDPLLERKDQLGEEEREHLEDAVTEMCEYIENFDRKGHPAARRLFMSYYFEHDGYQPTHKTRCRDQPHHPTHEAKIVPETVDN